MVPSYVKICLRTLWDAGFAAYPVGGCVRDTLLDRVPGDWDVTSSALPEQVMALFEKTVPTGVRHGTVTVLLEGQAIEVTAFRTEAGYSDGRHPDRVCLGVSLEEDLSRRDFTVNAMAFAPDGAVIDLFGGREDLNARLLRTVGEPERRFREDALRILRGARFAAQLGFSLESATAAAMEREAGRLRCVSDERVVAELQKTLLSPRPAWTGEFFRLGAMERFGCSTTKADWAALDRTACEVGERWRALCGLTGLDITALPVSRALRRSVLKPEAGKEKTLALTGGELYALGLRGEAIGRAQRELLDFVRERPERNERQCLLAWLKKRSLLD